MIRKHLVLLLVVLLSLGLAGVGAQSPLKPKSKALSARETKRILETTQHSLNDELSRTALAQVFDLADGRALVLFEDGKGRLYESKDELRVLLDEVEQEARKGPVSICRDLPQGQAFVEQVPQLVRQLSEQLSLDATQLDGSEVSLNKVDNALRRLRPQRLLTPDVFAPLTAYVGEVMRKATNGRWEMRRGSDLETWEPWIVDPSGRAYAPFAIYKELLEYGRSSCLRCFVAGTLGAWRIRALAQTPGGASASNSGAQQGPPQLSVSFLQMAEPCAREEGEVVTGAPFSATAVSETTQTLASGVHFWQKTQSNLFRDSQGRFRSEDKMSTSFGLSTSSVVINDPVAGTSFALYPDQKTAVQLKEPFPRMKGTMKDALPDKATNGEPKDLANLKTEDLGTQTIAGVVARGRRVAIPIPSGQTGNENPITVVLETWCSDDLHAVVMSKRNDPWSGETTYKLTNIQRTEPDASLFAVPAGYTVTHGVSGFR